MSDLYFFKPKCTLFVAAAPGGDPVALAALLADRGWRRCSRWMFHFRRLWNRIRYPDLIRKVWTDHVLEIVQDREIGG